MIKAIDRMKVRCRLAQIGCCCCGEWLASARRVVVDEETGLRFLMIMRWASGWDEVEFDTVKEDVEDFSYRADSDHVDVPATIVESKKFQEIKAQLQRGITKRLAENGTIVNEDLSVKRH